MAKTEIASRGMRHEQVLENLVDIIEKNIECGLLLDWNVKVKDNSLARKLYPDHVIRNGWLYGKE